MNESAPNLHRFLAAAADGDRAALERIYLATGDKLYGIVLRILRRPDLAEKALAEVYLQIWREAGSYDQRLASPTEWMITMARRSAHAFAGERTSLPAEDTVSEPSEGDADREKQEASRVISEELKQLLSCLAALSSDVRHMLLLAHYDGWSYRELAIEFDAPPSTIRTWLLHALEHIRGCASR